MSEDQRKSTEGTTDEGRRRLLKAAAVAGGATAAAALLPGSWKKPVATIGGLPAHAQTSQAITLRRAQAADYPLIERSTVSGTTSNWIHSKSHYDDPLGEFTDGVEVWTRIDGDSCVSEETRDLFSVTGFFLDGDAFSGDVYFSTYSNCSYKAYIAWTFSKGGRTSNMVNCSIDTLNQTDF